MKITKNILTTGEAFLECLKANSSSIVELQSIFDAILIAVEKATTGDSDSDSDSEQYAEALENAIVDCIAECYGMCILSEEVKDFYGLDEDKEYFLDE